MLSTARSTAPRLCDARQVAQPLTGAGVDMKAYFWRLAGASGSGPKSRYGHTLTMVNNRLYMFGGYSKSFLGDLSVYNNRGTWIEIPPKTVGPRPRFGHVAFEYNTKLYIFGGDCGFSVLNDLWQYDPYTYSWTLINVSGELPSPRVNMAGTVVGGEFIIFGGCDCYKGEGKILYNDVYRLNLQKFVWTAVNKCGKNCKCNNKNCAPTCKDQSEDSATVNSEPSTEGIDLEEDQMANNNEEINNRNNGCQLSATELIQELNEPAPRQGHILFTSFNNLYLFGGCAETGRIMNDLWRYDLRANKWYLVYKSTDMDCTDKKGSSVMHIIDRPSPRVYPAMCNDNDHVYIFGGVYKEEYFCDMWEFNGSTETFIRWDYEALVSQAYLNGSYGPAPYNSNNNNNNNNTSSSGFSDGANNNMENNGQNLPSYESPRVISFANSEVVMNDLSNKMVRPPTASTFHRSSTEGQKILPVGRFSAAMAMKYNTIVMFGGCSNLNILSDTWELKVKTLSDSAEEIERENRIRSDIDKNSNASYKLILIGFKKFIRNEVDKLSIAFNDKDEKANSNIEAFNKRLDKLNNDLDVLLDRIDKNCEFNDAHINEIHDLVTAYEDENGHIVNSAYELAQNTEDQLINFRDETNKIMDEVRRFIQETDLIIEEKRQYNENLLMELNEKREQLEKKMQDNLCAINNKLDNYEKQLNSFEQKIQSSANKLSNIEEKQLNMYATAATKTFELSCYLDDCKKEVCEKFEEMKNVANDKINMKRGEIEAGLEEMLDKREETYKEIVNIRDEVNAISEYNRTESSNVCSMGSYTHNFVNVKMPRLVKTIDSTIDDGNKQRDKTHAYTQRRIAQQTNLYDTNAKETKENMMKTNEEGFKEHTEAFNDMTEDVNNKLTEDNKEMEERLQKNSESIKTMQDYAPNIDQELKDELAKKLQDREAEANEHLERALKDSTENVTNEINDKYAVEREALEEEVKKLNEALDAEDVKYNETNEVYDNVKMGIEDIKNFVEGERGGIVETINIHKEAQVKSQATIDEENAHLAEERLAIDNRVEELKVHLDEFKDKQKAVEETLNARTKDFTERSDAVVKRRNEFDEQINRITTDIDELKVKIDEEIASENKKIENMHERLNVQVDGEKQYKEDTLNKLDKFNADINENDQNLDNDCNNEKDVRAKVEEQITQVSERVDKIVKDTKQIKESTDRFENTKSRLDTIHAANEELAKKHVEVNEYADGICEQVKNEYAEKATDVHQQVDGVKTAVQEYLNNELKPTIESANKELFDNIEAGREEVKKLNEPIFEDAQKFEENKARMSEELQELRIKLDESMHRLVEINEARIQSFEELLKHIREEEDENKVELQHIEDNINDINKQHEENMNILKKEIDEIGDNYQNKIDTTVQYYVKELDPIDFEFMKELPVNIIQLESDADELNTAILETKMQVKSHATQLSAMKTTLRELASVGNRAYKSSSELIGRIKSGEADV